MASAPPDQSPRFAVQRAAGRGWKTFFVDLSLPAAESAFQEVIRINPKGFFRLVRLDPRPPSEDGQEFKWTLIALHDPRSSGGEGGAKGGAPGRHRPRERVRIPLRLYVWMVVIGALLAFVLLVLHHPR